MKIKLFIGSLIIIIFGLLISLYSEKMDHKYQVLNLNSIPHIELTNYLSRYDSNSLYSGEIKGFVKFDNQDDQPKGARQYYIITPLNKVDKNLNQLFQLENILALSSIPPSTIETLTLTQTPTVFMGVFFLEDENNNKYKIDTNLKLVTMTDSSGEKSQLITNQSDYRDFITNFLK